MGTRHELARLLFLATILAAAGCGREDSAPQTTQPDAATAQAVDSVESSAPPIQIIPTSNIHPERFPHAAHGQIDCARCHTSVPGHGAHATMACAECHETATGGPLARPTAAECSACHHGPAQVRPCIDCHGAAPAGVHEVSSQVVVSARPRTVRRNLPFDHGRHEALSCSKCHLDADATKAPQPCSTCHADHHTETRSCLTCHAPDPATHDRTAHLGCGGAGCHTDAAVSGLRMSRQVCLVCHSQQVQHEPGQDCARCHLVGTDEPADVHSPLPEIR